jgi:DNA-binding MarR family transcriptional regulator
MRLLWAVVHGLERTSKHMSSAIGVTGPQRLVLRLVGLFPGLSAGDVSTMLHVHPSTLTGVMQRLAAQRLVARVRDPHDHRRVVLRLTARGAHANAVRRGTVESAIAAALKGVRAGDRRAAKRVLTRLARHLDLSTSNAPPRSAARDAEKGVHPRADAG